MSCCIPKIPDKKSNAYIYQIHFGAYFCGTIVFLPVGIPLLLIGIYNYKRRQKYQSDPDNYY